MSTAIRSRDVKWLLSALLLVFLLHQTARLEKNAVSSFIGNDYQYIAELLALPSSDVEGQAGMEGKRARLTLTELMQIRDPTCHDNDVLHLSSVQSQDHQTSRTRIPKVIHQADFDFTCHGGHDDATDNDNDNNNDNNKLDDKQAFKDIILQWKNLPNFDYHFHTRPQMEAFLYQDWPEFPHLTSIAMHCIPQRQGFVDLWKALILWEFGGGVVDYDWVPKTQDNNNNFQDLIQPHDQAILFMDVRSITANPHDRYTSILFMEPKHPLAYYLVMRILSRISHHRHLHSISHADWAFLSGSQVLDLSFVHFTVVDTSDAGFRMRHHAKRNRKFPPKLREHRGRYNRTLRIVDAMDHVQPSDTTDMTTTTTTTTTSSSRLIQNYNYRDWRGNDEHYPSFNNHDDNDDDDGDQQHQEQQWNATCIQRRLKYFVKSLPHLEHIEPIVES